MTRFAVDRLAAGLLALLTLIAGPLAATAQTPKAGVMKSALSLKSGEPATPEQAARVLDLRAFPLLEGAKVGNLHTLGMLMYDAKATPKAAFDFQRKELAKLGFKELPGGYSDANNSSGHFTKDGFVVAASTSAAIGEPDKAGWSSVSLVNSGNVDLGKLPVPPGVKPFHPNPQVASYTTDAKVGETAAACRKLLLAAGWEPYGEAGTNDADSSMLYYKRNAIQLLLWVSTTQAEGGKTLIRYSTELLSVDLPAPHETKDLQYDDTHKRLSFTSPKNQAAGIIAFYQVRLPKLGWKATTEKPIVDDRSKSQFLVFRNSEKSLLALDLVESTDAVHVTLKHQTEAELAAEERRAKEQAEKQRLAEAKRNMKITLAVPLPAKAEKIEHEQENLIEFTLATGSGPAALEAFREHFTKEGWTEEEGSKFERNTGDVEFKKDRLRLRCSYFDTTVTDAEIRVSASKNVVLEPTPSKDKPAADAPKPVKKPKAPAIPGLPELPPGIDLPDDVNELLKKALEQAEDKPVPAKKKASP